jgi:hypothetical protein
MRFILAPVICLLCNTSPLHTASGFSLFQHLPPGRRIDIGGRKLHLNCSGRGSPTVILVAGGNAFSIDWALVQPRVAANTRVCSYDRAGLAWSDSGPADETIDYQRNCRRRACGSMSNYGRSGMPRRLVPKPICHGGKNFCASSTKHMRSNILSTRCLFSSYQVVQRLPKQSTDHARAPQLVWIF